MTSVSESDDGNRWCLPNDKSCNLERLFYTALFTALEQTHCLLSKQSHVTPKLSVYRVRVLNIHGSGVLRALCGCNMAGATWNCCHHRLMSVYTIQSSTRLEGHIPRVRVCLPVTCHLHLWQDHGGQLRATAVTGMERIPK